MIDRAIYQCVALYVSYRNFMTGNAESPENQRGASLNEILRRFSSLMPCKKISPFYRASAAPGEFHAESGIPDEHALRGLHFMCLSCRSPMNGWGVISEKADFVKLNLLHF